MAFNLLSCRIKYSFLLVFFISIYATTFSQYTLNGSATQDNCHCYTLTPNNFTKSGSVWNNNKIDLTKSFTFTFNVFFGCNDSTGADGIAFILQPVSTSIGSTGSGLGYEGVSPAIGVTMDTWQNAVNNDPYYDHLAIQINGDLNHTSTNNLAGPVPISSVGNNVEDCNWHNLKIDWDASLKKYQIYFDGVLRLSLIKDIVKDIFNGDPKVFWGFTGSTGGSFNLQQFCTTLNPSFTLQPNQKRCAGEKIFFSDSSVSFGPILKRFWNFGDGSPVDSVSTNPEHTYTIAKDYAVSLKIIGADGCEETNIQTIRIGSKPISAFSVDNSCIGSAVQFTDSSKVSFGTINNWYWNLGDANISQQQNPTITYPAEGLKTIALAVKTAEGCESDTLYKSLIIKPRPVINDTFLNACVNSIIDFKGITISGNINQWNWNFGDNYIASGNTTQHKYTHGGKYVVALFATGDNGCLSDTIKKIIRIYGTNANAGNDTIAAQLQPVQLNASGGVSYYWMPATGLNNQNISNPVAILSQSQTYVLKAFTPEGCETYDTITIKIYKGPEIYVPTAFSPNNDGKNDLLKALPVGLANFNFKIYNRWGQVIFQTIDGTKGWDGRLKSIMQPPGIYVWTASGIDFNNKFLYRKGSVMLIR